jgi:hypothetical protein
MSDVASQLLEFPPETFGGKKLSLEEYDKKINDFLKTTIGKLSHNKVIATDADQDLLQVGHKASQTLRCADC